MAQQRRHGWMAFALAMSTAGLMVGTLSTSACSGGDDDDSAGSSSSSSGGAMCSLGKPKCILASQCGAGFACLDATTNATCAGSSDCCCVKQFCETDADCDTAAGQTCNRRTGVCSGLKCDPANPASCQGGQVCVVTSTNGNVTSSCQASAGAADRCTLDVQQFSLRAGDTRAVTPTGLSSAGAQVPYAQFTFGTSAAGVATVSETGVVTAVATGDATITATPKPSGTACSASLHVYGTVGAADARAVVFNSRTGAPMSGVTVQLRKTTGNPVTATTDASGTATFTGGGPAADIKDISAFPAADATVTAGYGWTSYVNPGTNDVAFYVDPLPDAAKVAGVAGTFDLSHTRPEAEIKIGLAAFSIGGALSDLSLSALVGPTVPTDITIPGASTYNDVPLPSGLFLQLSAQELKSAIDVYAEGPCPASAPCNKVLWGLGGQLPLAKVSSILTQVMGSGSSSVDPGKILAAVLPYVKSFYHFARGGISVTDQAAAAAGARPGFSQNITVAPAFLLSQTATWTVPTLPALPTDATKFLSGAVLLTGSVVPGQGVVPLGLSAGLDACADVQNEIACKTSPTVDGVVACGDDLTTPSADECGGLSAGDVAVTYAPPHDGLEGTKIMTAALALDIASLGAGSLFTSVLVSFENLASTGKNAFPAGAFMSFNHGSFTAATRTYHASDRIAGAQFYRLRMNNLDGKPWMVYVNSTGTGEFDLEVPPLPAGVTGERMDEVIVQGFKLFAGTGMPAGYTALVEFNSTNVDKMLEYSSAFSAQTCTPIYPARNCAADAECAVGFDDNFKCDTVHHVCQDPASNVTAKGSAACPTGTRELAVAGGAADQVICSQVPACEMK